MHNTAFKMKKRLVSEPTGAQFQISSLPFHTFRSATSCITASVCHVAASACHNDAIDKQLK